MPAARPERCTRGASTSGSARGSHARKMTRGPSLYAAMRPRFGAGAKTAIYAAMVVWLCGLVFHLDWLLVGMMSTGTFVLASALALVQVSAAATVGSWLYREAN